MSQHYFAVIGDISTLLVQFPHGEWCLALLTDGERPRQSDKVTFKSGKKIVSKFDKI